MRDLGYDFIYIFVLILCVGLVLFVGFDNKLYKSRGRFVFLFLGRIVFFWWLVEGRVFCRCLVNVDWLNE